jgi:hypothetical protein
MQYYSGTIAIRVLCFLRLIYRNLVKQKLNKLNII